MSIDPVLGDRLPDQLVAGETYVFKGGTDYIHGETIQVNAPDVTFTSSGEGRCTFLPVGVPEGGKTVRVSEPGFTCDNLHIVAPGAGDCLLNDGVDRLTVRSCYLDGRQTCVSMNGGDDFTIENNSMVGAGRGLRRSPGPGGTTKGLVNGNRIELDQLNMVPTAIGVAFGSPDDNTVNNWDYGLVISNNTISGFREVGINCSHNRRMVVTENTISGSGTGTDQIGAYLGSLRYSGDQQNKISANNFSNLRHGILARSGGGCYVFGNTFDDNKTHIYNNGLYADNNLYTENDFGAASWVSVKVADGNCGIGLFHNTYAGTNRHEVDPGCQIYGDDL